MKRSATLPSTTLRQNTTASAAILRNCSGDLMGCGGTMRAAEAPAPIAEHASMWHSVRNTGLRKPYVLRSHLFRISSPVLDAYLQRRGGAGCSGGSVT